MPNQPVSGDFGKKWAFRFVPRMLSWLCIRAAQIHPAADRRRRVMAANAFDTLDAARKLKAAGIVDKHAEAIVEVMGQSVNQLVTTEHFDAEVVKLHARIDGVEATVREFVADLRADSLRTHLISVGVMIAAIALAATILGIIMTQGGGV